MRNIFIWLLLLAMVAFAVAMMPDNKFKHPDNCNACAAGSKILED
jgi:hypothetical protein